MTGTSISGPGADVTPGQAYVVEPFRPEDAEGVSALFRTVYGDSYPVRLYYDPQALRQARTRGEVHPVTARLADGNVIGFTALYRSTAPYPGLLEAGLGMVHPAYRGSFVMFHLFEAVFDLSRNLPGLEAIYGEAVTDTIITQYSSSLYGLKECAIELELMPGYGDGRIACLGMIRNLHDRRRPLFLSGTLPAHLREALLGLIADLVLDREILSVPECPPRAGTTRLQVQTYAKAGVNRINVFALAEDGVRSILACEAEAAAQGCVVFQLFLDLGQADVAAAVPELLNCGYRFCGIFPRWFDTDAMLVQKNLTTPDPTRINLYSDKARQLLRLAINQEDHL